MNTKVYMSVIENFKLSKIPFLEKSKTSYKYGKFTDNLEFLSTVFYSRQIAAITGAPGTGKSSLIFYALNELEPSEFRVVTMELSNPNKKALYKAIAAKLGIKPCFNADDIKNQIINFFNEENAQGKFNCIIIDEAHTLSIPMFDEIRSFYDEGGNFSLVLAGLPSLNKTLNLSINIPLKQRISLFLECQGLSLNESREYMLYELELAKAKTEIFDEKCFPLIHTFTGGSIRKINQICYTSMLEAFKDRKYIITEDIIKIAYEKVSYA